jgi:hypothetical protein
MLGSNNLSDVASIPTSRNNLGLGTAQIPTFSQVLLGNAPSAPMHAATKTYVDASPSLYISDTAPVGVQDGSLWWDSNRGTLLVRYNDGDSVQWVDAVAVPGFDTAGFVQKAGDTMTGALVLPGDPTSALHAVPKQYVDTNHIRHQRVSLAGSAPFVINVPVTAQAVRMTSFISIATPTGQFPIVELGFGGVYPPLGSYALNGFHHIGDGVAVVGYLNYLNIPGMLPTPANEIVGVYCQFDAAINVRRLNTGALFQGLFNGVAMTIAGYTAVSKYFNFLQAATVTNLQVDTIRINSNSATPFGADSFIDLEWL